MKGIQTARIIFILMILMVLMAFLSSCQKINFIPGASYGYYVWEEDGKIHISWSIDRKDTSFSGSVKTDGTIDDMELISWEDQDNAELTGNSVNYMSTLGAEDYNDGLVIEVSGYEFIELDLRINDGYDLSRVHLGAFLNNPDDSPFRIDRDYFDEIRSIPWYEKSPFSGIFYKLFTNKYFTFPFLFVIGVIVIELLRITVFYDKRMKKLYTGLSYILLACFEVLVFFVLRFFVL